jgi:hypothetical protein
VLPTAPELELSDDADGSVDASLAVVVVGSRPVDPDEDTGVVVSPEPSTGSPVDVPAVAPSRTGPT